MTPSQAVQLLKANGATAALCKPIPRIALEEAIKAVMAGTPAAGVVAGLRELRRA